MDQIKEDLYNLITETISAVMTEEWALIQLNVQFLGEGVDIECDGIYLTPMQDVEPLIIDYPEEVIEALQKLYLLNKEETGERANLLQIHLTNQGQFKSEFSWDQELQDEDEHFSKGGTAREWMEIRKAKYGSPDEQ